MEFHLRKNIGFTKKKKIGWRILYVNSNYT